MHLRGTMTKNVWIQIVINLWGIQNVRSVTGPGVKGKPDLEELQEGKRERVAYLIS